MPSDEPLPEPTPIVLGSSPRLTLGAVRRDDRGAIDLWAYLSIAEALDARTNVYLIPEFEEAQRLTALFNRLSAAYWTGWEGTEAWESAEHGLSMEWRWRKLGFAEVDVRLTAANQVWSVRSQLQVHSGELELLGRAAKALLLGAREAAE